MGVKGLSLGGNAKIIYRQIGDMAKAWGFGLDVGAQYKRGNWQFGATGRDITSTFNSWSFDLTERTIEVFESTGNEIPQNGLEITLPKLSLGAARSFNIKDRVGILVELNADITTDGKRNVLVSGDPFSVDPNLGIEIDYMGIFFIRGGFGNVPRIKAEIGNYNEYTFQPNIGIGVNSTNTRKLPYKYFFKKYKKKYSFNLPYILSESIDYDRLVEDKIFSKNFLNRLKWLFQ